MPTNTLVYQLGLKLIPGIGDILAKNLVAYCGSAEAVFHFKKAQLLKVPGIGPQLLHAILSQDVLERAEEEMLFMQKNEVTPLFYHDDRYPTRLKQCYDSPYVIYFKGNADLNATRILSIVGTRNATDYGRAHCASLMADLQASGVLIVSGMAYGIDIAAHKAALKNNLATVGVLAHGLDRLYPEAHQATAEKMLAHGGLLSEYMSGTTPEKEHFPERNRIVAGMADATIVIESKKEGGSLITAEFANSYSRDVFAFPGKTSDSCSAGCNELIRKNKAALVQSAKDILEMMNWEETPSAKNFSKVQPQLLLTLQPEEEMLVQILQEKAPVHIDELCMQSRLSMGKVAGILLQLEFNGLVKSLPGKMFRLN